MDLEPIPAVAGGQGFHRGWNPAAEVGRGRWPAKAVARSSGFHRACGTTQPSVYCRSIARRFALARRSAYSGDIQRPVSPPAVNVLVFRTVPSANTLARRVKENAFAFIAQARPCPTFGRPVDRRERKPDEQGRGGGSVPCEIPVRQLRSRANRTAPGWPNRQRRTRRRVRSTSCLRDLTLCTPPEALA